MVNLPYTICKYEHLIDTGKLSNLVGSVTCQQSDCTFLNSFKLLMEASQHREYGDALFNVCADC